MSQLLLTHPTQFQREFRTHSAFPMGMRVGKFFLFFSMTFLIGLLSFFYLVKFTEIHTKGYELRKLEIERNKLMTVKEAHNTKIASSKSLAAIRESSSAARMVPARSLMYVQEEGNVAFK